MVPLVDSEIERREDSNLERNLRSLEGGGGGGGLDASLARAFSSRSREAKSMALIGVSTASGSVYSKLERRRSPREFEAE